MTFTESLEFGFLDSGKNQKGFLSPRLITNNLQSNDLMKNVLRATLSNCDEYFINVAFITVSGLAQIRGVLVELDERNIKGKIVVSSYQYFTEPLALSYLMKFKNVEVRLISEIDSHAKCYVVSKKNYHDIIVGSSNLTKQALTHNNEWNLQVISSSAGDIYHQLNHEFNFTWQKAKRLTPELLNWYTALYFQNKRVRPYVSEPEQYKKYTVDIVPNSMQKKALDNLINLRENGAERALIISATGTGKTYLSAFDVKRYNPKKFLFIVHRRSIAKAAMETFKSIMPGHITMGLYSGEFTDTQNDYIFATIQTLSRKEHIEKFDPQQFEYIVIDETHRSGSSSYQMIIDYFKPKFLLGMTATPERTDGYDIFKLFHNNIAHEIRLNQAMKDDLLCDFHYYGITDIKLDNRKASKDEFTTLEYLNQAQHVLDKVKYYGADSEVISGLVFCSGVRQCRFLADYFAKNGYRVQVIDGDTPINQRDDYFDRLELQGSDEKLDYLFSVDVLNEGIDIPKVNQVVMVRPTQSAIVFVQQLGRGLRKANNKEFLTVLDFIGNYEDKNFLIPVALFGDRSFNKDKLRRLMVNIDQHTPISSTINFDLIAKEQIFKSIDATSLHQKKFLDSDYDYLKRKLGRIPLMCDFLFEEERDPYTFVNYSKSYARYLVNKEISSTRLNEDSLRMLDYLGMEVNNGKRVIESAILNELLINGHFNLTDLSKLEAEFNIKISDEDIESALNNLNFRFNKNHKVADFIITDKAGLVNFREEFKAVLTVNPFFMDLFVDNVKFGIEYYKRNTSSGIRENGFELYSKYSRKDFSRIANLDANEEAVIFGYKIYSHIIPLFVTLKKDMKISKATQYEDYFINQKQFHWMSKHSRNLKSKDILTFLNNDFDSRPVMLFIQKSKLENDFYCMGRLKPADNPNFIEGKIDGKSVVQITWELEHECPQNLYEYFNAYLGSDQ
jgi:superfamily II DNA or RNA helicase/HKD family nuclease